MFVLSIEPPLIYFVLTALGFSEGTPEGSRSDHVYHLDLLLTDRSLRRTLLQGDLAKIFHLGNQAMVNCESIIKSSYLITRGKECTLLCHFLAGPRNLFRNRTHSSLCGLLGPEQSQG